MNKTSPLVLIIPSYNPDHHLLTLLQKLRQSSESGSDILLVDDGSDPQTAPIFKEAQEKYGCFLLRHEENQGKGRALKTAFADFLSRYPEDVGVVTVDSDGQHKADDVAACAEELRENPHSLIVGCRQFDRTTTPPDIRRKNAAACKMLKLMGGVSLSDIQSGLRGIPTEFVRHLVDVPGERFDFELNMLMESRQCHIPIKELPIQSIEENGCTSSVNPLLNLLVLYKKFIKFAFSSVSCFVIDILLFSVFVRLLKHFRIADYILIATVAARIISSLTNYLMNRHFVFTSHAFKDMTTKATFIKFYLAEICQMMLSATLVSIIYGWVGAFETLIKVVVDAILFFLNYPVQQRWVFTEKKK